ncbi:MAG: T9SS type A sorting domain-containing protein [Saprospiraceae bacterium]
MTKFFTLSLVLFGMGMAGAQTVSTITSSAITIDDDIIFDKEGNLYGSHFNGSKIFTKTKDGQEFAYVDGLNTSNGLAFHPDGSLLVCDIMDDAIYKVTGRDQKEVFNTDIPTPSNIIQIPGTDSFYVATYNSQSVYKLAPDGSSQRAFTSGWFDGPVGMCFDEEGNFYVANFNDKRIVKFLPDGTDEYFSRVPLGQYLGFIAYRRGFIYATAFGANKLYKIDMEGNPILWLGSTLGNTDGGRDVAKFNQPNGLRFSSTLDTLYVSDYGSRRVRMITDLDQPASLGSSFIPEASFQVNPNPVSNQSFVFFEIERPAELEIAVNDLNGKNVGKIWRGNLLPGNHNFPLPEIIIPGTYIVQVSEKGQVLTSRKFLVTRD